MEKYWSKCQVCGEEFSVFSRAKYHMRTHHELGMAEYRVKFGLKKIPHNKRYESSTVEVPCCICGKKLVLGSGWHAYRLRKGRNRFACLSAEKGKKSDCCKKLQSLTIKEVRSTPESRAKTTAQITERWKDPDIRESFKKSIKAKGKEWQYRRMAAVLKSNRSGKMTKPELKVQAQLGDDWEYVGNGALMIGGLNPDFAHKTEKKLVEVFGCYWHGCQKCFPGSKSKGIPLNQRISTFKKYGYGINIIWEHELK